MRKTFNAIRCKACGVVIVSMRNHDFVTCDCETNPVSIDDIGHRRLGPPEKYEPIVVKVK